MNQHLAWYVSRASGITAYFLVAASVLWGLALSTKMFRRPRPAWMLDLHRFLGGAAVIFTGIHVVGLFFDQWMRITPAQALIPMADFPAKTAQYQVPVAWGVVALYLLLTVEITSLLMNKLPRKVWHGIHLTSLAMFVLVTVHLFTAGSDTSNRWLQWAAIAVNSCAALMLVVRLSMRGDAGAFDEVDPRERARADRRAAIAAAKAKAAAENPAGPAIAAGPPSGVASGPEPGGSAPRTGSARV